MRRISKNETKRTSALVCYTDSYSINGNSDKDITVGYEANVVGSNNPAMSSVRTGTFIVVHNQRCICVGEVIGEASNTESKTWSERGGRDWKYNFKVRWLSEIVPLTSMVKLQIKELCDYEREHSTQVLLTKGNIVSLENFFNQICHSGNFRTVVSKLILLL